MQINIGTESGEVRQVEAEASDLAGKQIGESFDGGLIGLPGYKLEITGGSDKSGFPMRESIEGSERRRVLIEEGAGVQTSGGVQRRKSVRGNTVSDEIQQLNTKVVEEGDEPVEELLEDEE